MQQQIQQALSMLSNGRAQDAIKLLTPLEDSTLPDGKIAEALGHCYLGLGNNQKAKEKLMQAQQLLPQSANIAANLGGIYQGEGDLETALKYFTISVEIDPEFHQAWHFLSLAQCQSGNIREGLKSLEMAQKTDPLKELVVNAKNQLDAGNENIVRQTCQQILSRHKSHPQALSMLASMAIQQGQLEEAENYLHYALAYSPYEPEALNIMTQLQGQLRQYTDALLYSDRLTKAEPQNKQNWQIHADNLLNAGKFEHAVTAFGQVHKLDPSDVNALLQQAHTNKIIGNNALAIEQYVTCSAKEQVLGSAYWALANLRDYQFEQSQISSLQNAPEDPDMDSDQACQCTFALAKIMEEQGRFDDAFAYYQNANMNRAGVHFIPEKHKLKINALMATFNQDVLSKKAANKHEATPIFILGLPRSGSTLVEQILASHSQIEGTMELKTLPALARKVFLQSCRKNGNNSGSMANFSTEELSQFGQWYLRESQIYRSGKPYFIDKLPPNFQHIGLIHMILPHAIIIDARRQPLACGMGIYKQYFGHGHDFSYNLEHIGCYYNQYLKLMDYWQKVLPGKVLTLQHESLVADTESQVRALLDHCQLPFEQQCLSFHENKRAVRTASSDQVRQPINTKGIALWKHYESHLTPLKDALGEDTLARFSRWIEPK